MNKKIYIVAIIVILAVTALVFGGMWKAKNKKETGVVSKTENNIKPNATTSTTVKKTDNDINGIESDLNSISDSEFSTDQLSDQNVGL